MGMDIDKTRANDVAVGVDRSLGLLAVEITDFGDHAIVYGNVGASSARAGPIDHHAIRNYQIMHTQPPSSLPNLVRGPETAPIAIRTHSQR
jgi:hypothetical protein